MWLRPTFAKVIVRNKNDTIFIEEWCALAFFNVIALVHIYLLTDLLSGPKQPYTVLVYGISEPDFLITLRAS